mmetsp:Transcript_28874/g.96059  ORF Transcript_28874/g.96059 Transcript_28874/m.96059 type:complete len:217 (+) Transcript_28874:888-1538(+)
MNLSRSTACPCPSSTSNPCTPRSASSTAPSPRTKVCQTSSAPLVWASPPWYNSIPRRDKSRRPGKPRSNHFACSRSGRQPGNTERTSNCPNSSHTSPRPTVRRSVFAVPVQRKTMACRRHHLSPGPQVNTRPCNLHSSRPSRSTEGQIPGNTSNFCSPPQDSNTVPYLACEHQAFGNSMASHPNGWGRALIGSLLGTVRRTRPARSTASQARSSTS